MQGLTEYEREQLAYLRRWRLEAPDWGTRLLARPSGKAGQLAQRLLPEAALQAALRGANRVALKTSDQASVLRRAGCADLAALREQPLEACDRLAQGEARRAMAMAGAGGAVLGVAGAAGMVADVPALLTLALRTIHRVGLCYGEDAAFELSMGVFALAAANNLEEKAAALHALHEDVLDAGEPSARDSLDRAAQRELAKDAAVFSLQTLAQRIGARLGRRKVMGSLPLLGAMVGSSVNAWYIHDVARVARYVFHERWLRRRYPQLKL